MERNAHKVVYVFTSNEASSELRAILKEFEQLCGQKDRVEKLMKALEKQIDPTDQPPESRCAKRTVHLPNCTVVTRLKVL